MLPRQRSKHLLIRIGGIWDKLFLFLFVFVLQFQYGLSQCAGVNCGVCSVTATVTSIAGGDIDVGSTSIPGTTMAGGSSIAANPLVITANSCGIVELSVELDFNWDRGDQANWIHGISFFSSEGWDAAVGIPPSNDWLFLDTIVGCCSMNGYGAGYYYDSPAGDGSSNCCGTGDTPNSPENNYGINCTTNCPEFGFNLTYCPDSAGTANEIISFYITEDGETGGWNDSDGCVFLLSFPITIQSAGVQLRDTIGPVCEGDCTNLDAGTGCTDYLWSTGEMTSSIDVCPPVSTSYSVTATGDAGCVITGEVFVLVEPCCGAEAGDISTSPQPACPNELVDVLVENYQDSTGFTQQILITDADGIIIEIIDGDQASVTLDECGTLLAYSYNYLTSGNSTVPSLGLNVNDFDCENNCCDLESIEIIFEDNEAPMFPDGPTNISLECIDLLDPMMDLEYFDNCDGNDFVQGTEESNVDPCNGGLITRTWEYEDACGNLGSHIQEITIEPIPVAEFDNPPADEAVMCSGIPISAPDLNVTNNGTGSCLFSDVVSPIMTGTADACGGEIMFTWEVTDNC
ncbi:MAG: hypothetical protein AAGK97_08435, partial [Bacteroidota bacterium]